MPLNSVTAINGKVGAFKRLKAAFVGTIFVSDVDIYLCYQHRSPLNQ